jgi:hypothetical protein
MENLEFQLPDSSQLQQSGRIFDVERCSKYLAASIAKLPASHKQRFRKANVFIRSEYKPADGTSLGLSYNLTTAEKGVPSEEYLYAKDARFWRYSDINRNVVTFNAEQYLRRNMIFRTTLWGDFFNQQIDAYDSTYSKIVTKQKDKDFTFGNRFALEYEVLKRTG